MARVPSAISVRSLEPEHEISREFTTFRTGNFFKPGRRLSNVSMVLPNKINDEPKNAPDREEVSDNSDKVLPFLHVISWSPFGSFFIYYDQEWEQFRSKRFIIKMILAILWLLFTSAYLLLNLMTVSHGKKKVKAEILVTLTLVVFCILNIAFIKCFSTQGKKIAKILSDGRQIFIYCNKRMVNIRQRKKCKGLGKYLTWLTCFVAVAMNIAIVIGNVAMADTSQPGDVMWVLKSGFYEQSNTPTGNRTSCGASPTDYSLLMCKITRKFFQSDMGSAAAVRLIASISVQFVWTMSVLLMAGWGIYFRRLLSRYIDVLEANKIGTLECIRLYTRIANLLQDFNNVFGWTTLCIVIEEGLRLSVAMGTLLSLGSRGYYYNIQVIISGLQFLATLLISAEVNDKGSQLPSVLNNLWFRSDDCQWTEEQDQILQIVHYGVLSSDIGLKGLSFFTISYGSIGSYASIVLTFTLVAMQYSQDQN